MTRSMLGILLSLSCFAAVGYSAERSVADYRAEIEAWRARRVERLASDTGWLTLAGLHRLKEGRWALGSSPEAEIPLPASAPGRVGELLVTADAVTLHVEPGVAVTADGEPFAEGELVSDAEGDPTVIEVGPVSFFVIRRGDLRLLRVRDRQHPNREQFAGIESFPIDPAWRLDARFEPHEPDRRIPIANIIGQVTPTPSWGAVVFRHGGESYRIDAVAEPGDERLFLIFGDRTNGRETYGGGRYLYVDAPDEDGRIDLDFNRAYNPPCAFTEHATCPLPPTQNRLPIRIEAGEKGYSGGRH